MTTIEQIEDEDKADALVETWLGDLSPIQRPTVNIDPSNKQIVVEVRSFDDPIDEAPLIEDMKRDFPTYDVAVQWIQTLAATTTTQPPPEPTEQLLAKIEVVVDEWLITAEIEYQVDSIVLDNSQVRIAASGDGDPPPLDTLIPRLQEIDQGLSPWFTWARLETTTDETVPTPLELTRLEMEGVVNELSLIHI